jgi:hypothetical protein
MTKDCCKSGKKDRKCRRKGDGKVFKLPRKFSKKSCMEEVKGFTKRSSCAPYKGCKKGRSTRRKSKKRKSPKKRKFLYNPNDPKKSFDVYIDKNPNDTIPIKYRTYTDTKNTIRKLESLYKKGKYAHKRIFQVAMILRVRLKVLKKDKKRAYELACRYYDFIKSRTKVKGEKARKKLAFKY